MQQLQKLNADAKTKVTKKIADKKENLELVKVVRLTKDKKPKAFAKAKWIRMVYKFYHRFNK